MCCKKDEELHGIIPLNDTYAGVCTRDRVIVKPKKSLWRSRKPDCFLIGLLLEIKNLLSPINSLSWKHKVLHELTISTRLSETRLVHI